MKTLAIAAATLGLVVTASPAFANPGERPTLEVSVAGLDLDSPEGQRLLEQRISRAAREVCQADRIRTGTRISSTSARACVAKARATAERQVAAIVEEQQRGG